ncbi:fungal hydrophobin [Lentinus tigrinus ALCF2SS1-7]|uniref:Hydrophobin n=1 Tax=Lentinus tigrinus ALCF2SS1-6 TaxID=1328759 RepID=A0A5C2SPV1_9APHY|nr:fungal hydrophobin [Lentinus tigrinus ALCF2SS1-6]RPD79069.1 fungal hydrophobin [Lentinus tigrinus ALCF2SS1-7]
MLARAYALVSLAVLATATPWNTGTSTGVSTVTTTATTTVTKTQTQTQTLTEPPKTVTEPGTGTCTATAPVVTVTEPASDCTTGPIQCCEGIQSANTVPGKVMLGLLGIILKDLDVFLGLNCDPITGVGVGSGNACTAVTVCCENNAVGSLISIGCIPVFL